MGFIFKGRDVMRKRGVFMAVAFLALFQPAWAQRGFNKGNPAPSSGPNDPNAHAVNLEIFKQMKQVRTDLKDGKLSKEQAKAEMVNIKSTRRQELEFFQQNGGKKLTDSQKAQVEQMLAKNSNPASN
jgi:hypothetical protein